MFKHFLITRFNLRNPEWTTSKKNKSVLTEEWYENFKILPSVPVGKKRLWTTPFPNRNGNFKAHSTFWIPFGTTPSEILKKPLGYINSNNNYFEQRNN